MVTFNKEHSVINTEDQNRTSYDPATPPNLISFMLRGWKPAKASKIKIDFAAAHYAERRNKIAKTFPGEVLIIPAGHLKVRSNDTYYPFRPTSDFFYLTGCKDADSILFIYPDSSGGTSSTLFVYDSPGKKEPSFFTDRVRGELWEGPQPTVQDISQRLKISCEALSELDSWISEHDFSKAKGARILPDTSSSLNTLWTKIRGSTPLALNPKTSRELAVELSEMRLLKDPLEVKELQIAINSTYKGFCDVIRGLKNLKNEREIEGIFYTRARLEGNDVGYGSIAASGEHACTLHWRHNNGDVKKGDLLLLDAGVEGHSYYTADITRTLPISGKFTKEQKQIYNLVHAAQQTAMKAVKPGNGFLEPNRVAMEVLAKGLIELGILKCTFEEAMDPKNLYYRRYTLHNVSHMLGLDVHDCAQARQEAYKFGKLQPGMVLTVEPGVYLQPDDETVPPKYRGIGIRIEDDVVVTEKGCKNLSAGIPTKPEEVEKWMKKMWSKKK